MKNEELIKRIYNNMIKMLVSNVSNEYHNEMSDAYMKYLMEYYGNYDFRDLELEQCEKMVTELEESKWKNLDQKNKLSMLLVDQNLEEIYKLNQEAYGYAVEKLLKVKKREITEDAMVIDKEVVINNINKMKELLLKVRDFNSELASQYVGDGILDYNYAAGNSINTSLRVGRVR